MSVTVICDECNCDIYGDVFCTDCKEKGIEKMGDGLKTSVFDRLRWLRDDLRAQGTDERFIERIVGIERELQGVAS